MLTVIVIMILGITTGYLIRSSVRLVKVNETLTTYAIYALLFSMGVSIGTNKEIVSSLHTLGVKALIISIAGVLGSALLGWLTYRVFFKNHQNEK
ncbi:MAG: LysO family transporter [Bacteroidales bacterium]